MSARRPNALVNEASPYLLQHAYNPVDWLPWGETAFEKARREDKPVFLSVGYSACHWCHVMERESFEDEDTAAYLNAHFVCVKVDREERPDVDGVYMDAVQAMTGQGGWPMSVWLTPDGRPFYAGTYFPDQARHGLPSFKQVLSALADAWSTRRDEIEEQGTNVARTLGVTGRFRASDDPLTRDIEEAAVTSLRRSFDPVWGGFGTAPKFPQPMVLEFLLRMAVRGSSEALEMVTLTLDRMADGGIHDQVGGGFARYSTDQTWHVPHFEKMLYDNAQLALVYTHAWLFTRDDRYRTVAEGTLDYLLREMHHPSGAFFSSQDADSEGVEGRFYVWSWDELVALVGPEVAEALDASRGGNWEGTNVLQRGASNVDPGQLEQARRVLFSAREGRTRPAIDDKIVTAWNGLAIRAFAEAGRAFGNAAYREAAIGCARSIWDESRDGQGRLARSRREGVNGPAGFADDHALIALAFLTIFEITGDERWYERARGLCDGLLERFADEEGAGFYQTATDGEQLLVRPKDLYDNPTPSGNSAGVEALLRLHRFSGEVRHERAGGSALSLVAPLTARAPLAFGHAASALDLYLGPTREVAIVGDAGDPATTALTDVVLRESYRPNVVLAIGSGEGDARVPLLEGRARVGGLATAYVCERFACKAPVTNPRDLDALLRSD
jgi:uncharacterized protein YyaL (SSP411 family)